MTATQEYLKTVQEKRISPESYRGVFKQGRIERLYTLAEGLSQRTVLHMNTSCFGGGVGENLSVLVPFMNSLGVACHWQVVEASRDFFATTMKLHHHLQGLAVPWTGSDTEVYEREIARVSTDQYPDDLVVVHDYQLVPVIQFRSSMFSGKAVWASHLETSSPTSFARGFLEPFIRQYDAATFAHQDYVFSRFAIPLFPLHPSIDPCHPKNQELTPAEQKRLISAIPELSGVDIERPIILSCSRFDVHKNLEGNLKSFLAFRRRNNQDAIMILVGDGATMDGVDNARIARELVEAYHGRENVYIVQNPSQEALGALMSSAKVLLHLAHKEGFGRVITESLWHKTPVIATYQPGVSLQVIEGITGWLVDANDTPGVVQKLEQVVKEDGLRSQLGRAGRALVRENFLIDAQALQYLTIMNYLVNNTPQPPVYDDGPQL
jgi:trehalose synthase